MSLAEGTHVAGMAMLLAFAAAFILSSARAAKPADGQELPEIITALTQPSSAAALPWRDLELRLRGRWSDAAQGSRPPGLESATTVRTAQLPARFSVDGKRRQDSWQVLAWGSQQSPNAVSLRRDGQPVAGPDLEQALRAAGVPFMLECETSSVRHYRLSGPTGGYAAEYEAGSGSAEILFFFLAPPEALLQRDGCLVASARH